jgi:hypothetical protein
MWVSYRTGSPNKCNHPGIAMDGPSNWSNLGIPGNRQAESSNTNSNRGQFLCYPFTQCMYGRPISYYMRFLGHSAIYTRFPIHFRIWEIPCTSILDKCGGFHLPSRILWIQHTLKSMGNPIYYAIRLINTWFFQNQAWPRNGFNGRLPGPILTTFRYSFTKLRITTWIRG